MLKKYTVGGVLFTAVLGTLSHFFYKLSGENSLLALLVPVSESTWEHMKMLFFPMLLFCAFESVLLRKRYPDLFFAGAAGNSHRTAADSDDLLYLFRNSGENLRRRGYGSVLCQHSLRIFGEAPAGRTEKKAGDFQMDFRGGTSGPGSGLFCFYLESARAWNLRKSSGVTEC